MAQYDVLFDVPKRPLGNTDIGFDIKRNGSQIGRLKVHKRTIEWIPKGKPKGIRMRWRDFDEYMQAKLGKTTAK